MSLVATSIGENDKPYGIPVIYANWKNHGFKCSNGDSITLKPEGDWKPLSFSCLTNDLYVDLGLQALSDGTYKSTCSLSRSVFRVR
jgi:hypothetical protein